MPECSEKEYLDIIIFIFALILSAFITWLMIIISRRRKIYDYPSGHKTHARPTPFLGGAAIFSAFWISFLAVYSICGDALVDSLSLFWAFFLSSSLIFLVGLWDDLADLRFYVKLIFQVLAAVILISFGFKIDRLFIPFWGSFDLGWLSYGVTIAWVVILTNSINLIDGMDGLAAVISASVCIGLLIIAIFLQIWLIFVIALILAGCVLGFLLFNKPPARIFMGDSGSLFIGFALSFAAVVCPIKSFTAVSMFVPLVAVSLPLLEIVTTVIRRALSGKRIYQPDKRHIFHYLREFGFSDKRVLLLLGAVSLLFNAFIPALFWFDRKQVFSIFVLFLMILIGIFFILKLARSAGRS
jgi:UDP-GlcNAc:undecaprenyl-phosphate GlcNAc-1-phosphate transferase